jgi:Zn-dependent membrane protease YugP
VTNVSAESAGFKGAWASYDSSSKSVFLYNEFFELRPVIAATSVVHEYGHSFSGNEKLWAARVEGWQAIPHPMRSWEVGPTKMEGVFRQRYSSEIIKRLGMERLK